MTMGQQVLVAEDGMIRTSARRSEPENDGGGDADGRHEVARAAIVGLNVLCGLKT
jgi:hypothetical protein